MIAILEPTESRCLAVYNLTLPTPPPKFDKWLKSGALVSASVVFGYLTLMTLAHNHQADRALPVDAEALLEFSVFAAALLWLMRITSTYDKGQIQYNKIFDAALWEQLRTTVDRQFPESYFSGWVDYGQGMILTVDGRPTPARLTVVERTATSFNVLVTVKMEGGGDYVPLTTTLRH